MDRKKVLLIFVGAWLSAAVLTWFLYASTKAPKADKTVAIEAAARDLPAGTRLKKGDLKVVRVRDNEVPKGAILDEQSALDRPLLFFVSANEPVTSTKIGSSTGVEGLPSAIDIGKRAISVSITDTSGVAGLIQPRAHVDVLFTRPGSMAEAVTTTILEDVIVLAIGRNTEGINSSAPGPTAAQVAARPSTQSATLLVTPEQARKIELAKNQGKIGLALRNPLDHTVAPGNGSTTAQALYADFPMRKPDRGVRVPPPPPPPVQVVKTKEPPKPKSVVDVFRGDKHVQDSF